MESLREPHIRALLDSGEFPRLNQFMDAGMQMDVENRFELGLDWLLDGFAARLGR